MDSFDSNSKHMIYGPDADLIMLGLLTHIENVFIFRDKHNFGGKLSKATKRFNSKSEF